MTLDTRTSVTVSFACALSTHHHHKRGEGAHHSPTRTNRGKESRGEPVGSSKRELRTIHHGGTSSAGRSQRGGLVSDYKGERARGSTCRGWLRRRMLLGRTREREKGRKNPRRGAATARAAGPRPRAGSPGEIDNQARVPGSSGRRPREAARGAGLARGARDGTPRTPPRRGVGTWLPAAGRRGRRGAASGALPPGRASRGGARHSRRCRRRRRRRGCSAPVARDEHARALGACRVRCNTGDKQSLL